MFKKIIWTLLVLALSNNVYAQQTGTPATLRIKIDANGYLLLSATSQTNPVTTSVFGQARLKTDASGNLLVVLTGGGTGAPANGPYIIFTANSSLTGAQNVGLLSTGLILNTVSASSATFSRYAGASCTNQFFRSLNNSAAVTCATVTATDTDTTIAHTGVDINTSNQVTATHLGAALPVNQGGTNATSASITAFNNITGLSAAGTTGTTSTNLVFSTSPTFITPILGTPTSGTATNITGLPEGGLSLTDITTNNSSTSKHGFLLKLNNSATSYMDGTGAWSTPAAGALAFPITVTGVTSGGILYNTSTTGVASSALLTNHSLIVGAGAGAAPKTLSAMTTGQQVFGLTGADPVIGQTAALAVTPSNPTATSSATDVMMGLGSSVTITPVVTGRVKIQISGSAYNLTVNSSAFIRLAYGSGSAPSNGAASTGTPVGASSEIDEPISTQVPFTTMWIVTGLTLNTAYWADLIARTNLGSFNIINLTAIIQEF